MGCPATGLPSAEAAASLVESLVLRSSPDGGGPPEMAAVGRETAPLCLGRGLQEGEQGRPLGLVPHPHGEVVTQPFAFPPSSLHPPCSFGAEALAVHHGCHRALLLAVAAGCFQGEPLFGLPLSCHHPSALGGIP